MAPITLSEGPLAFSALLVHIWRGRRMRPPPT